MGADCDAMKKLIFTDLHERMRQTSQMKRRWFLQNEKSSIENESWIIESFEFLIFLEIRDSHGNAVTQYPVSIGHEPILKELMCEQLTIYKSLLPGYPVAVIAVENSLVTFEEWNLFCKYQSARDLVNAVLESETNPENSTEDTNPNSSRIFPEKFVIEAVRSLDDEGRRLPLVISIN
jgi:hypothetical protein